MRIRGREIDRLSMERHGGDLAAVGGVRLQTLVDGSERGIRVLEFRTAAGLRFECLVDRAMDVGVAELRGLGVGWRSPTGFRHPSLHEIESEDGLSWLRSMSGLMVTAGLDHTLFGDEVDASDYRYPPKSTVRHGLHGRIGNIPATLLGYGEEWRDDRCVLWAEGEMRQAAIFGEHLRLRRRIEADLETSEFTVIDRVRNHGFERTPHMFLYHINLGWPFLEEGCQVEAKIDGTLWQSDSVQAQGAEHLVFGDPVDGFVEQVSELLLRPESNGQVRVRVVNDRLACMFEIDYDPVAFPSFFGWVNRRSGSYALGLEPSTHRVQGDNAARADESMIWLEHGETREYVTTFRFNGAT